MSSHYALALLTPDEMAQADQMAGNGPALMEAAGGAVARAIQAKFRPCRVLVLAGPGNNGGDGYVVARHLEAAGWDAAVAPLAPPRPGTDAAMAAGRWRGRVLPFTETETRRAGLVVDALFGAGLTKPLDAPLAALLRGITAPVVAVDIPSGVCGATGAVRGFAPQAALTVTFFRRKPGHLLNPGRDLCGELHLADIGLPSGVLDSIGPRAFANGPALWTLPKPGAGTHKHSRGHVVVLCGEEMPNATRLAAQAARRAGAGLVTLACQDDATARHLRMAEPGLLVTTRPLAELAGDARFGVFLLGPGLPADATTRAAISLLRAAGRPMVLDAGALTACAGMPEGLSGAAILTPHAGEFARVFGPPGEDRPTAVRAAAARTGAAVLLKGSDTLVAAQDGRLIINHNAPPWLATGGTGDVLAGVAAALLAQGMAPLEAAAAASWLQGEAARRAGPGMLAEDLSGHFGVLMGA